MTKATELLFGENRATIVERSVNTLEQKRRKLEAQILAVKYKDQQEKGALYVNDKSDKIGFAVEKRIVENIQKLKILPVIESAPVSIDQPNGSSKVDIILMLPSGRVVGVQVYSAPEYYSATGAEQLAKKSKNAIDHGIKKLQRMGRRVSGGRNEWYKEDALGDFPMPVAVAAVDENRVLEGDTNGCAREFLHNLSVGLSPDIRRKMVEHYNPGAGLEELTNRWSALNLIELEPYLQEVLELEKSLING